MMGTDIHPFLEIKLKGRKRWVFISRLFDNRNYDVFALFEVRGDFWNEYDVIPDGCDINRRHLPSDVSSIVQEMYNNKGHSLAVVTGKGLDNLMRAVKEQESEEMVSILQYLVDWSAPMKRLRSIPMIEGVRVVLWFDS